MIERRAAQRFDMRLPVIVRAEAGAARAEVVAETRDVSSRGLYFIVERDLTLGSPLEAVLTLPAEVTRMGPVRIRCQGRIVRVEEKPTAEGKIGIAAAIDRYEFLRPEESVS